MIAFGEYGLGRELAEYMSMNEIWTWLWFNPESYACEVIGFDTVNNKVIIYNGVNFNYGVVRTLEIKDFVEEYGDTVLFAQENTMYLGEKQVIHGKAIKNAILDNL